MELNLSSFREPDVLRETSIMDETPLHHESTSDNDTAMAAYELVWKILQSEDDTSYLIGKHYRC